MRKTQKIAILFLLFAQLTLSATRVYAYECRYLAKKNIEISESFEFSGEQVEAYHTALADNYGSIENLVKSGFFANSKEVLDVGCGDGKNTAYLAEHMPSVSVVGCDISQTMIDFASNHYSRPNLRFIEKDAQKLDFPKHFDVIISFNCLHWIKNQKEAVKSIFNALKPGGKIYFLTTPDSADNDFKKVCSNVILSFRWLLHFISFRPAHSFHTEEEYRELLSDAGFSIDKIQAQQAELIFKNRDELDPFLKSILTPLLHLPENKRQAFLNDIYKEFRKLGRVDLSGAIHICFDEVEIMAQKAK